MRHVSPTRLIALVLITVAAVTTWFAAGFAGSPVSADDGGVLIAGSVCEAHELRARKAANPDLQIEVPQEYDVPWPTRQACLSYAAASNPATPGPLQPIPFSHKHHAGLYQIDCQYCHTDTNVSPAAGVPPVEVCMGCHSQFPASYDEFEGIRKLKQHWEKKQTIEWVRIYWLPEYVQFQHRAHTRSGIQCQQCHGPVEEYDKLPLVPDTIRWPWGLPSKKLEMGWCINCHRQNGATQDCYACHY